MESDFDENVLAENNENDEPKPSDSDGDTEESTNNEIAKLQLQIEQLQKINKTLLQKTPMKEEATADDVFKAICGVKDDE